MLPYHHNTEENVEPEEDRDVVGVLRPDGLAPERLKDVPRQYEDKKQVEAEVTVEETSGMTVHFAF